MKVYVFVQANWTKVYQSRDLYMNILGDFHPLRHATTASMAIAWMASRTARRSAALWEAWWELRLDPTYDTFQRTLG